MRWSGVQAVRRSGGQAVRRGYQSLNPSALVIRILRSMVDPRVCAAFVDGIGGKAGLLLLVNKTSAAS